ncbi:PREDICTED: putative protein arginine N-methyltransferase 9 isoform X2 [Ceratosolen solmsi marchali]|uniref:Protein arginine N-methyltransferase 9-like n=1 Tax=Ceratosolen solmsi marchali TaxID=326594 RepID=A0AAJ7DYF4_9HYME|nr:PREDICTED: putative protein arginine N-methyltransferase 9 isoform X2 [Ceratosolen solmsi marchali]
MPLRIYTIMQEEVEEIIKLSLKKALDHDAQGNIGQAYAYYTAVLEFCPSKRAELKKRFTTILCEWGIHLEQNNRMKDIIKCYENSLEIFPDNSIMLNNFAAHFLRNGEFLRAIKYLQRALEADQNFLPAERNLQNAYSMAVDRWHFTMLNDKSRNHAFYQAITKRVCLGYNTVLDIGTGTGLLSLYAREAGAHKIYACEYSPAMCNIAKEVFNKNKAEDIKLICKASTDLKIPEDIPERVKLIVTEIFDAALFGELVIPTLIDAHNNLLVSNGTGIVIPMSATLYVAAVECEYIRFRTSVSFNRIKFGSLNFDNICILSDEDYYDTENLENVNINYITEPRSILKVNFNDINKLNYFNKDGVKEIVTSVCRYDCIVDGLVAWFKLNLDEEIVLDSSQGKSCWQLAVFPTFPKNVRINDKLILTAQILNGRLKCSYELAHKDISLPNKFIYQLPRDIITFLNDEEYTTSLIQVATSKKQEYLKTIFDTCPFPIYGLTILKENKNCEILYYRTNNIVLKNFIEHIVKINNIIGKIYFISDYNEIINKLDNIIVHDFDMKGELIDCGQQNYREIYRSLLNSNGYLFPERIFLMGQFVYSEELPKMISVKDNNLQKCTNFRLSDTTNSFPDIGNDNDDDECCTVEQIGNSSINSFKYMIADFINKFKINQVFDLNSSLYNYKALSDVKILVEIDESEMKEKVINFGKIDLEKYKTTPNALICWYKIHISNDKYYETKRKRSFMNHTAIVFESELEKKALQGEDVNIKIQQMHDLVKIKVI